jgi:hypothetical protein
LFVGGDVDASFHTGPLVSNNNNTTTQSRSYVAELFVPGHTNWWWWLAALAPTSNHSVNVYVQDALIWSNV